MARTTSLPRRRSLRGIYYGWVMVVTLAITETTSWGILFYSFAVFVKPMSEDFGWSRGALTGAYSLALALSGLTALPVGRWLDRRGPRLLMTAGSCAATLAVLVWAAVQSLTMLYLVWAAIGIIMAAVLYEPAFQVVATWFRRKRGRALTVLTFIAGFASVIYIPLAGFLVQAQGWRTALVTLAVILAVGTIPLHALVLRRSPQDLGLQVDGECAVAGEDTVAVSPERSVSTRDALRGAAFWLLAAAFFLNGLGGGAIIVHLVPYLTDHGYSAGFAASMAGTLGILALPGRLIFTPLGDRVPRSWLTAFIFCFQAMALVALLTVQSTAGVLLFVALFGMGFGAITPMRASLVAEFYGPAHYGSISGVLAFFLTGARAGGPLAAGIAYDLARSYRTTLWVLARLALVAAGSVLLAERSARQQ